MKNDPLILKGEFAMAVKPVGTAPEPATVVQHAADTFTVAGLGVGPQMSELKQRETRWWRRGKTVALIGGVFGILTVVALCAMPILWPASLSMSELDVPSQIAAALPSEASSALNAIDFPIKGMTETFLQLGLYLGILMFFVGLAMWMLLETSLAPAVAGLSMAALSFMLQSTGSLDSADSATRTEMAVVRSVEASALASTPAGLYVRAQEALSREELNAKDRALLKAAADSMQGASPGFVPQPRVAALIEQAAYGKARSPAAVQYAEARSVKSNLFRALTSIFAVLAGTGAVVSVTLCLLGSSVGRRRQRLSDSIRTRRAEAVKSGGAE
ncbi:hypothetical protein K7573_20640 (plasmid) [Stenotrophomonas maltophilia]|uniref:hypothetical protein n=1 Tax=Stenotrophomonas maltophilia TaxID=40324 RepID=UPI001D12B299|nr:hypothetical protein [Stenotrophomonas maltophilia]UXF78771.1 hypothetical protein K7573_20640 [Stenotrophomonas maltophilia]